MDRDAESKIVSMEDLEWPYLQGRCEWSAQQFTPIEGRHVRFMDLPWGFIVKTAFRDAAESGITIGFEEHEGCRFPHDFEWREWMRKWCAESFDVARILNGSDPCWVKKVTKQVSEAGACLLNYLVMELQFELDWGRTTKGPAAGNAIYLRLWRSLGGL